MSMAQMDVWREMAYQTPLSNSLLYPLLLLSLTGQKHSPDSCEKINDEYDYIIVGGGAAGSVVAGRLSEEPCVKILLLEAGPKPPLISEVPGLSWSLLGTDVDWKFKTVPQQRVAAGMKSQEMMFNAGKMLGGSGSHNGMLYVRGNHKNYDDWAAQGVEGWSYEDVLPYFFKSEDNKNPNLLANGYHHAGGPITVDEPRFFSKFKEALHDSAEELGYQFVDSNGAKQTGFYDYQTNMRNGQRCSSVKGYLVPAEHRPNLDILLNAVATKVIIEDNQAKGVVFYQNGKFQTVRARKEVIVSGGALNSPKLLMLSGVGPREELEKWNIPVVADLPVGRNLQDHGVSKYYFTIDPQFSMLKRLQDPSTIVDYINYRTGPLTNQGLMVLAFLDGLNVTSSADFPNYQLYINEVTKENEERAFKPEVYRQFLEPIDGNRTFCICSSGHLQPRSRGTITLRSPDPFDPPVIDPNYLEDPKDLYDIVDGLRVCKKIVNTKALQSLGARPFHTLMSGCEEYASSDEDYFKCFVRHYFLTTHHFVGTAKMGDSEDPSTVVDPELRVKGVKGLRVVDASVMPIVPSGNTNIPTLIVAEKASDIIKKSINCSGRNKFHNNLKLFEYLLLNACSKTNDRPKS